MRRLFARLLAFANALIKRFLDNNPQRLSESIAFNMVRVGAKQFNDERVVRA